MFAVCVFCVYDYVLQSAESRLDSSLTKMNHPAKPLGDQQAFWDTWPRLQRRLRGWREPTPPSLPDPDTLPSSPPLCPSSPPPPPFFLISLTVPIIAKHLMKIDLFLCLPLFPPFPSSIQISTHAYITLAFYLILFLSFPALYLLCYLGYKQNWKACSPRCIYRHMTSSWLI